MMRLALLGANGFIGTRAVEMLHLGAMADVRPVVRTPSSAAGLSRFDLDVRVADARDAQALSAAFAGCDVVVHAVSGSPDLIVSAVEPVYHAAVRAGVRRVVYLSSASVHGQAPRPGTDEASPLSTFHLMPYNSAKVRAERTLHQLRARGDVEVVLLRPAIVFGPRSAWIARFADALLAGRAYLVNGGRGVCNSVYVDNLVHAIHLAAMAERVDGEAFFVGDREQVTWRDLFAPVAQALGVDVDDVPSVGPALPSAWQRPLYGMRASKPVRVLTEMVPKGLQRRLRRGIASARTVASPRGAAIRPSLEDSLLQTCRYRLPFDKSERLLEYHPPVSFEEGCRRTVAWMTFAGYSSGQRRARRHGV